MEQDNKIHEICKDAMVEYLDLMKGVYDKGFEQGYIFHATLDDAMGDKFFWEMIKEDKRMITFIHGLTDKIFQSLLTIPLTIPPPLKLNV